MKLLEIDPQIDRRWLEFLERHPEASVFHTPGWLEALRKTYGYSPFVVTSSEQGEPLRDGIVFCEISSWLTGRRIVSLPFSDHCQPLIDRANRFPRVLSEVGRLYSEGRCRYIELRPRTLETLSLEEQQEFSESASFVLHTIDLRPDLERLFAGFHRSSIQRRIRRAERASLEYERGVSESILNRFYHLTLLTRRRHGIPPQPIDWFRNLIRCLGDQVEIHLASEGSSPVAGILTIRFRDQLVYKYGASDARFNQLGATPWLFWKCIQLARERGLRRFDLGRSDLGHEGLIRFKAHFGSKESKLTYFRWPPGSAAGPESSLAKSVAKRIVPVLPDFALRACGRLLYRHMG